MDTIRITAAFMAAHLCLSAHAAVTETNSISELTRQRCQANEYDKWFTISPGDNLADSVKTINQLLSPSVSTTAPPSQLVKNTTDKNVTITPTPNSNTTAIPASPVTPTISTTTLQRKSRVLIILPASDIPYVMNSKLAINGSSLGICSPRSSGAMGINDKKPATIRLSAPGAEPGDDFSLFFVSQGGKLFIHGVFINALERAEYAPIVQLLSDSEATIEGSDIILTPSYDIDVNSSIVDIAWKGLAPVLSLKNSRFYNGVKRGNIVRARPQVFRLAQRRPEVRVEGSVMYVTEGNSYLNTVRTSLILTGHKQRTSLTFAEYTASLKQLRNNPLSLFTDKDMLAATTSSPNMYTNSSSGAIMYANTSSTAIMSKGYTSPYNTSTMPQTTPTSGGAPLYNSLMFLASLALLTQ
ncbi:hypothetical protein NX722_17445 [Endozoicomonas gorgoniicola]|uniref:Uncharacterized protein n=1 Tax=Endozoicomonas gorgoniicola TaxID=1234144 RepID=A0ABT3MYD2_9GAMM|nr:hypothetical protein [Endozoicomonas gorgoniicola]MCW7554373.1 hypothetical protein [Endozoicomonas gorgoniicola]